MEDVIKMRGSIELILSNINGQEIEKRRIENTVVTAGRKWVLQNIISGTHAQTAEVLGYMGVGTGTTAPATGDSALGGETTRIAIGTFTTTNLTSNPPSFRAEASFATDQANTTLGEVALFNSSETGTMLARATFGTINKTTSNTLSISYTISN